MTRIALTACLFTLYVAFATAGDAALVGAWGRTDSAYSPGLYASASSTTFQRLEFGSDGRCVYRSWSAVSASTDYATAISRDDDASVQPGRYTAEGGRLTVKYDNGNSFSGAYSVFDHQGSKALKIVFEGSSKPTYYHRKAALGVAPRPAETQPARPRVETARQTEVGGKVVSVTPKHNQRRGDEVGMLFEVTFEVSGAKGKSGEIIIFFADKDGTYLKDFDNDYHDPNGLACTFATFKPEYDAARFSDVEVFIPYSQLHLASGRHDLLYQAELHVLGSDETRVAASQPTSFWVKTD